MWCLSKAATRRKGKHSSCIWGGNAWRNKWKYRKQRKHDLKFFWLKIRKRKYQVGIHNPWVCFLYLNIKEIVFFFFFVKVHLHNDNKNEFWNPKNELEGLIQDMEVLFNFKLNRFELEHMIHLINEVRQYQHVNMVHVTFPPVFWLFN